jgi:hypothetical protein
MKRILSALTKFLTDMKKRIFQEQNCCRELEKGQQFCSECTQIRRDMSQAKGQHKYLTKNRDKHNARCLDYHHRTFKSREYYRELARS